MKIYVSEKDIKENNIVNNTSNEVVLTTYSWDLDDNQFKDEYPLKVISLEQHEAEVRKHVIAELEEWVKKYQISVGDYVYITALNLNAKLCKMKAELEATPQGKGEKDE